MMKKTNQPAHAGLDLAFVENYDRLLNWCRSRVLPANGTPEELVHSTYIRCRKSWSSKRCSRFRSEAYLFRTLRCVLIDDFRRGARELARTQNLLDAGVESYSDEHYSDILVHEAIGVLPPRQRQVCERILSGRSVDCIANELHVTKGAIAVHLFRARENLRKYSA